MCAYGAAIKCARQRERNHEVLSLGDTGENKSELCIAMAEEWHGVSVKQRYPQQGFSGAVTTYKKAPPLQRPSLAQQCD